MWALAISMQRRAEVCSSDPRNALSHIVTVTVCINNCAEAVESVKAQISWVHAWAPL